MRSTVLTLSLALLLPLGSRSAFAEAASEESVREGPVAVNPAEHRVGELIDDVTFTDLDGKPGKLSDFRDAKATVICMTGTGCPVARKYGPVIASLQTAYQDKGVAFLLVNPNAHEKPDEIRAAAKHWGFTGRIVYDPEAVIGKALAVTSSTEVFVLDAARTLQYRGAVDDQFGLGYALPKPRNNYLSDAIDAVLAARRPYVPATTAPGCALDLKPAPAAAARQLTYHNRVSRIIENHCAECHRPGEAGPFTLTSYADVKGHAAMIKKVVRKGIMPPWFADPKTKHPWGNDRSLSERDRGDLIAWIESGTPEGDPNDAPVARDWTEGWRIGKPDAVFEVPYAFDIPATGTMGYQRVAVPTNLSEDKWVSAVEVRPTSPGVVHHVLVFLAYPPEHPSGKRPPRYDDGLTGYFAGLVPGQGASVCPPGTARFFPKHAILIFQIHYTPNGKATKDRPKIGLVFSKKPPKHEYLTDSAFNHRFRIPPGAPNYEVTATHDFRKPVRLLGFMPHTHVRGKAFRYELFYPDGRSEVVLDVPRYDFNWQLEYQLRNPIDVPAGAKLKATAWYDNSPGNPANPDPTKTVKFGDQTWEEMMIGYFAGHVLDESPEGNDEGGSEPEMPRAIAR